MAKRDKVWEVHGDPWVNPAKISLVTREEWGARPPKVELDPLPLPVRNISYSCNTEIKNVCRTKEECIKAVQEIQRRHMDEKGLDDIGYSFLIGDDNNVYEGRGFDYVPALTYENPPKYLGTVDIAYIGIHEAKYLHWSMYENAEWLKKYGLKENYIEEKHKIIDFCDKEDYFEGGDDQQETENTEETPPT